MSVRILIANLGGLKKTRPSCAPVRMTLFGCIDDMLMIVPWKVKDEKLVPNQTTYFQKLNFTSSTTKTSQNAKNH